jgi:signal transduction histidine kinase
LHIVRQTAHLSPSAAASSFPARLRDPAILQGAIRFLAQGRGKRAGERDEAALSPRQATTPSVEAAFSPLTVPCSSGSGFVDWSQPGCSGVYQSCLTYARTAQRLAELSQRGDPHSAWAAGLLAPLGWLAACAVDPAEVTACLADPAFLCDPILTQQQRWGYDQAGIARRLARRWRLPDWLTAVVGHLGLPGEITIPMGADPDLLHVVQLAVGLVQQRGLGLHLTVGGDPTANAASLGLSLTELSKSLADGERQSAERNPGNVLEGAPVRWTSPYDVPLLHQVLSLAAENLRLLDSATIEQLERERDRLHHALEKQRHEEAERLKAQKLNALAEFAAGAAHEINNPLAVISGQAQYLLGREVEPARQRALQTINGQALRIHQLLNELMQFARPPRLQKEALDLRALLREVALSLSDLAAQRQVQLICPDPDPALMLQADTRLLRTALECLLRNAIEAAPAGGWAGMRVVLPDPDHIEFIVEDSGTGPAAAQRDHLFDPFYSGRLAGRGRGFGLPTAWRLAREHGGDVRFDRAVDGPTRFILHLPRKDSHRDLPVGIGEPQNGHESSNGYHLAL